MVGTFPASQSIIKVVASTHHACIKSWYELSHAIETPMKFTRSFPANAAARENVPMRTIVFGILSLKSDCQSCKRIVQNAMSIDIIVRVFS